MVSLEQIKTPSKSIEQNTSPRISFSSDFLSDENFISISLEKPKTEQKTEPKTEQPNEKNIVEFEFLSNPNVTNIQNQQHNHQQMVTADELFFEGKLLPFWQIQHSENLSKITLKPNNNNVINSNNQSVGKNRDVTVKKTEDVKNKIEERERESWFFDDDPSPRPPKCTVLWKELLKLKKQRAVSSLSPSSSSSSSSSSNSNSRTTGNVDLCSINEEGCKGNQHVKRIKKGLERARSASIRIRPMINVPVVASKQGSNNNSNRDLPPLFPMRKLRSLER